MKIALFSCHNDPNYGSMLQAYALVAALKRLGVESEYLDYSTSPDPRTFNRIIKRILKVPFKVLYGIVRHKQTKGEFAFFSTDDFAETIKAYQNFHSKYIPVSSKRYYYDTIRRKLNVKDYEVYMVGSDQSWSPNLYNPKKPYFLDFADLPVRSSYAPSFGTTDLKDDYLRLIKPKLSTFQYLSCREFINSKKISDYLGIDVAHVIDPTLLLGPSEWDAVAKSLTIQGEYVLAYILGEKDTVIRFAEEVGTNSSLPVYYIVTRPKYLGMPNALNGVGPAEWLSLVRNARYVVTDSFHGCLFSINYNVNFYAFSKREGDLNSQDNVRILEFLSILDLQNRFQDDWNHPQLLQDIEFTTVNDKIENLREKSIGFLKQITEIQ